MGRGNGTPLLQSIPVYRDAFVGGNSSNHAIFFKVASAAIDPVQKLCLASLSALVASSACGSDFASSMSDCHRSSSGAALKTASRLFRVPVDLANLVLPMTALTSSGTRSSACQIPDFKQVRFIVYDSMCNQVTQTRYTEFSSTASVYAA